MEQFHLFHNNNKKPNKLDLAKFLNSLKDCKNKLFLFKKTVKNTVPDKKIIDMNKVLSPKKIWLIFFENRISKITPTVLEKSKILETIDNIFLIS